MAFGYELVIRSESTNVMQIVGDFSFLWQTVVAEVMAMAEAIKSILYTPILDDSGNLTSKSDKTVELIRKELEEVIA